MYLEEPFNPVHSISLDIPVYNPETDSKCRTPLILDFFIEGSEQILVGADLLLEGVEITLNTGEVGTIQNGIALIDLQQPLVYGNEVYAEINTNSCVAKSCSVFVGRISTDCVIDAEDKPSGEITGFLICEEKDLYRQVYDGDGGVINKGVLAQKDCIYCGGNLPNCEEPPEETTTYYNIISCNDNKTYQTTTVLTVPNQRVSHHIHGIHYWDGTTIVTNSPTAFRGEVSVLSGETGCPAPAIVYYNIMSCADYQIYQTPTVITKNNQYLSHGIYGGHIWVGTTTTTPTNNRGPVVIMEGIFGCQ